MKYGLNSFDKILRVSKNIVQKKVILIFVKEDNFIWKGQFNFLSFKKKKFLSKCENLFGQQNCCCLGNKLGT